MGFLVVNKNTGEVVFDKIYTTEGRAQAIINQGLRKGSLNEVKDGNLVVIPMPTNRMLKAIVESTYSTMRFMGNYHIDNLK